MDPTIPRVPHSLSLSDFTKSDNGPLIQKRTHLGPTVISSFSSHNQKNNNKIVVEEVVVG